MKRITTIDVHVAGEPLRVVLEGFPEFEGGTILEKRQNFSQRYDYLRRVLMWEPRGHPHMYGCVVVPPSLPEADVGVLFFHNEGYSTMCGHGIIGLVTVLLEERMVVCREPQTTIRLDTPSGIVTAHATVKHGHVREVTFQNVPSFVTHLNQIIHLPNIGSIHYDLAFGGAFYAFCQAKALQLPLNPSASHRIIELANIIKAGIAERQPPKHPVEPDLSFLYGTIFVETPDTPGVPLRQVCIFANGALDRSPTGTGISAHLAILYSKGQLSTGQRLEFESILGTRFSGRIVKLADYANLPAIIPEIQGKAYKTGRHEFYIDPNDPLQHGFFLN